MVWSKVGVKGRGVEWSGVECGWEWSGMKRCGVECNEVEWRGVGWVWIRLAWRVVEEMESGVRSGHEWTGAVVWRKGEGSAVQWSGAPTPTVRSNAFKCMRHGVQLTDFIAARAKSAASASKVKKCKSSSGGTTYM